MKRESKALLDNFNIDSERLLELEDYLKDLFLNRIVTYNFLGEYLHTYESVSDFERILGHLSDTRCRDLKKEIVNIDNSLLIVSSKLLKLNPNIIPEYLSSKKRSVWTEYDEISVINSDNVIIDKDDIIKLGGKNVILKKPHHSKPYAKIYPHVRKIPLHRFITQPPRHKVVDHINGNTLDNRKSNLRVTTAQKNLINRDKVKSVRLNKTSKYQGVSLAKRKNGRVHVRVSVQVGKQRINKNYKSEIKGARAYDVIMLCLGREFANTNFPRENYDKNFLKKFQNLFLKGYTVYTDLE